MTIPNDLAQRLYHFKQAGKSSQQIAQSFGMTTRAVDLAIAQYEKSTTKLRYFNVTDLGHPFKLSGDFMIVGDVHVPDTDYGFASLVARVAERHKLTQLIIAGDFFNMDAFSTHPPIVRSACWHEEKAAGRALLEDWMESFSQIWVITGNHERRLTKISNAEFDIIDEFQMLTSSSKVEASNWGWCEVVSGGIPWRVTHSASYRQAQLSMASDLAVKFQTNVISHHEHHLAKGWDKYGRYCVVNNGTLVDPLKLAYVQMDDKPMAGMVNGFTVLQNGTPYLYGRPPFTDWDKMLE